MAMGVMWSCTANHTCDWLWRYSWEVMDHPPYGSDRMPCGFHRRGPFEKHTTLRGSCGKCWHELSFRLLLTDTWNIFCARVQAFGATMGWILKCQRWLRRCLLATRVPPASWIEGLVQVKWNTNWCNTVQVLFLQSLYMFRVQAPIIGSI